MAVMMRSLCVFVRTSGQLNFSRARSSNCASAARATLLTVSPVESETRCRLNVFIAYAGDVNEAVDNHGSFHCIIKGHTLSRCWQVAEWNLSPCDYHYPQALISYSLLQLHPYFI